MATYYCNADSGNDTTGDGSSGNPWLTIAKAMTSSTTGDAVILQDSVAVYTLSANMTTTDKTISAVTLGDAVIDGTGVSFSYWFVNNASFTNLIFQNINKTTDSYTCVFHAGGTDNINFTNCIFRDFTIYNTPYAGLVGHNTYQKIATLNMIGCLIHDCHYSVTPDTKYAFFGTFLALNISNTTIHFSTTDSTRATRLVLGVAGETINFKNTIVNNASGYTMTYAVGSEQIDTSSYSDFYDFTGLPAGAGIIQTDPLFIDVANDNYRLRADSPCIGTGTVI